MKKGTIRLLGSLALTAGAVGAAFIAKKKSMGAKRQHLDQPRDVWARPGMTVTFRAELMPGREREQRTFRVKELLPSGRVLLDDATGEHAEREFEPIN